MFIYSIALSTFIHLLLYELINKIINSSFLINDTFFRVPDKIVGAIGPEKMAAAIAQYNIWAKQEQVRRRKMYDQDRDAITPEVHMLFVDTLQLIRSYYEEHSTYDSSMEVHDTIRKFFHASSVSEQIEAAHKVQELLLEKGKQY